MASTATTRRTKGAGAVFQDGKGVWHFRTERGYDPVTGKRLPPIETTGRIKSDTRDRHKAKILEYQRTGVLRSQKGPASPTTPNGGWRTASPASSRTAGTTNAAGCASCAGISGECAWRT